MLATYSYEPNLDAARELIHCVAPLLRAACDDLAVVIAGAGLSDADRNQLEQAGASVLGRVDSVETFYNAIDIAVITIRVRGGLPLKLVEALARSIPVVCTPELIAGTPLRPGIDVLVGTTAQACADAVQSLFEDRRSAELLGRCGRRAYDSYFSPAAARANVAAASLLGHARRASIQERAA